MRYVLYKIYELGVESPSHELQARDLRREGIFMVKIYIKHEQRQPLEVLYKKKSAGKHLPRSLLFNKVTYYEEHL